MLNFLNDDAFTLTSLTAAVNNLVHKPGRLGSMGLFAEQGINTTSATVEVVDGVLSLVPITSRGAQGAISAKESRKIMAFAVPHLPQADTVLADSVQNVREFGSDSALAGIQSVINGRMQIMRDANEYTIESHRVAAIQGQYFDAAGTKQSLYTAFDVQEQTVAFGLTVDTTEIRTKCTAVIDAVEAALGGLSYDYIHVMCSKGFFDTLITHSAVKETYLASVHAADLRGDGRAILDFGGLKFERYSGTSDVKIADNTARAFPMGVSDLMITRFAPANYAETVNTIGLPMYAKIEAMPFNKGASLEVQSNPLNLATRPHALIKLKHTAT